MYSKVFGGNLPRCSAVAKSSWGKILNKNKHTNKTIITLRLKH